MEKHSKKNTIEWLIDKHNPSVCYYALTNLLECPKDHPEEIEVCRAIERDPRVFKILLRQNPNGHWESVEKKPGSRYVVMTQVETEQLNR